MNNFIFIRVDASQTIGLGHLMRCIAIAHYLKSKGIMAYFISRSENIEEKIINEGFRIKIINKNSTIKSEIYIINNLKFELNCNIILIDINNYKTFSDFNTYAFYLQEIKNLSFFIISFEDFKINPPIPDIVVIPYVGAEKLNLSRKGRCKYLLGPKYFVLNNNFSDIKKIKIKKDIEKILITMGGSDSEGITLTILDILAYMELSVKLVIIIGGLSEISDSSIMNVLHSYKGSYSIVKDAKNMHQIMSESDIAIINSGLTKYETAATGLPSIVISNHAEHNELMHDFASYGTAICLGAIDQINKSDISESITNLINNYGKRKKMSKSGRLFLDGKGVDRIFNEIPEDLLLH